MAIRVVLVDDHHAFRAQARALLEAEGWLVVGEAAAGLDAVDVVRGTQPDLVLLDVLLRDIDGFQVATRIADEPDPPEVILVSSHEAAEFGSRVADAPVRGFLSKGELSAKAITAILDG